MSEYLKRRKAFWEKSRRRKAKPYFDFISLPASSRLKYEVMQENNYLDILSIFEGDKNPFVLDAFKHKEKLEEYVENIIYYGRFLSKNATCDWIVKNKVTDEPIGILHLYDLNTEAFELKNRKCTIGFSTKATYRGKGYTSEAVQHFIQFIYQHFDMLQILAYTLQTNQPCANFLQRLSFEEVSQFYTDKRHRYFELWRDDAEVEKSTERKRVFRQMLHDQINYSLKANGWRMVGMRYNKREDVTETHKNEKITTIKEDTYILFEKEGKKIAVTKYPVFVGEEEDIMSLRHMKMFYGAYFEHRAYLELNVPNTQFVFMLPLRCLKRFWATPMIKNIVKQDNIKVMLFDNKGRLKDY